MNYFSGYLFSTDSNTIEILNKFREPINSLTFSIETNIVPMKMEHFNERCKIILSSIVNERCTIAISTDVEVQLIDIQERNRKKLVKLQENLKLWIDKTTTEKYKKKAKSFTKERDLSQVRLFQGFISKKNSFATV